MVKEQSRYYLLRAAGTARLNYIVRRHWGIERRRRLALDITGNAAQARNRKRHCAANWSLLWKLTLNPARLASRKGAKLGKLKRAGWGEGFLINILSQFTKIHITIALGASLPARSGCGR